MSCKSALYMANIADQDVPIGGVVNFGTPVRRFGTNIQGVAGNVLLKGPGYYRVTADVTFTDTAAGVAEFDLLADGAPIPGATVQATTGTASGVHSVSNTAIIRVMCCKEVALTYELSGVAVEVNNATITVEKI